MVTFFSIVFALVAINLALLLFSGIRSKQRMNKIKKEINSSAASKIYPLNLNTSKYKKAI